MTIDQLAANANLIDHMGALLRDEAHAFSTGPALLRRILEQEAWREFTTKRGDLVRPRSFAEFVTTKPLKGLGADLSLVRRVASADAVTLDLLDQAMQRSHGGDRSNCDNVPLAPSGNSATKALRRLRKDAPELHAEVLAGRLSAHAAMLQAGLRVRTFSVRQDVTSAARSLRRNFSSDQLQELARLLAETDV